MYTHSASRPQASAARYRPRLHSESADDRSKCRDFGEPAGNIDAVALLDDSQKGVRPNPHDSLARPKAGEADTVGKLSMEKLVAKTEANSFG